MTHSTDYHWELGSLTFYNWADWTNLLRLSCSCEWTGSSTVHSDVLYSSHDSQVRAAAAEPPSTVAPSHVKTTTWALAFPLSTYSSLLSPRLTMIIFLHLTPHNTTLTHWLTDKSPTIWSTLCKPWPCWPACLQPSCNNYRSNNATKNSFNLAWGGWRLWPPLELVSDSLDWLPGSQEESAGPDWALGSH